MGRRDESVGQLQNPASCFLDWRSEEGTFSYWDKETEARVPINLPLRFLVLKQMIRITGFDEAKNQGIYSNEVKDIRSQPFNVRYQDGTPLARGLYSEIKQALQAATAKYTKSIYAMSESGELICIRVKGQGLMSFENTIGKGGKRWLDEWVTVADFETREKGEDTYSVPLFKFDGSLASDSAEYADSLYDQVEAYFASGAPATYEPAQSAATPTPVPPVAIPQSTTSTLPSTLGDDDDDLPF